MQTASYTVTDDALLTIGGPPPGLASIGRTSILYLKEDEPP
jgi:hypothetical protein